ncbi:MAG TPA: DUF5658 family protein [Pyrinomonadaceae bacterium]|nr:DUF5658 family protein [Pyrinomonadaceae bacterium]
MPTIYKSLLLFAMNWLDAQLTILWIRLNVATEANALMARLLNVGEAPFLMVKLGIGAFTAYVLYRCSHMPLAQRGMKLALGLYLLLMLVHVITGFAALGWAAPQTVASYFVSLPHALLSFFS